jgi:hypothetical protein
VRNETPDFSAYGVNQDRQAEIAQGAALPGAEGAYHRLLALADIGQIGRWTAGERARGTVPEDMLEAAAVAVAEIVFGAAQNMRRPQMKPFAAELMTLAATMVDRSIGKLSTVARRKQGLRVVGGKQ